MKIEIHKIAIDDENKLVQIDQSSQEDVQNFIENSIEDKYNFLLQFEYGSWMIECKNKLYLN